MDEAIIDDRKKILVLGIGILIFKDEGIGIHVVEKLSKMPLPPDVEVIDGGTSSPDFPYLIEKRKKVIAIDAMKAGGAPGPIYRFSEKDFLEKRKGFARTTQETELEDALRTTYIMKTNPDEFVVIGIEPADMGEEDLKAKIELSPILEQKIPEIIATVMREIEGK